MYAAAAGWFAAGLAAVCLARFAARDAYPLAPDVIGGLLGAVAGGSLYRLLAAGDAGPRGSVAVAFLGAWGLVAVARTVASAWGWKGLRRSDWPRGPCSARPSASRWLRR